MWLRKRFYGGVVQQLLHTNQDPLLFAYICSPLGILHGVVFWRKYANYTDFDKNILKDCTCVVPSLISI
jgi:hypothetical protein